MKKQILLLLMLPVLYNCVPQAISLPEMLKTKLQFNNIPAGADKVEITITDPNCKDTKLCVPTSLTIGAGGQSSAEVSSGNKIVNIRVYKNGIVISETTQNINVVNNQDNSIIIPQVSSSASPLPTAASTIIPSSTPSLDPTPVNTTIPIATPTSTVTPIPTSTPRSNGGSSGGGSTVITTPTPPTIQASATINPDNTGVR